MLGLRTWLRARRRDLTVLWDRLQPGPHALILAYHRVIDLPTDPYHLCTPPALFRQHLELLQGRRVVPLAEVAAGAPGIALTFDDGYFDNLETVAPLLGRLPATFFLTAWPRDREFWWNELDQLYLKAPTAWRLYTERPPGAEARQLKAAYAELARLPQRDHPAVLARLRGEAPLPLRPTHRLLTDEEIRRLSAFDIGAHTLNHERLSLLERDAQRAEIEGSRRHLEALLQRPVEAFAYPYGVYDATSVNAVKDAGFTHACTIAPGLVGPYSDRLLLPRVHADALPPAALSRLLRLGALS